MIVWLFILFLGSSAIRRNTQCKGCLSYKATVFPVVRHLSSDDDFNELRRHLLAQVDHCTRTNFSLSIYLPSTEKFIHCCNARDCTRRIAFLSKDDFRTNRIVELVDTKDSSGLFSHAMPKLEKNNTSIYIFADFLLPQICRYPELRFSFIGELSDPDQPQSRALGLPASKLFNRQLASNLVRNCNITTVSSLAELNSITKPLCSTRLTKTNCEVEKNDGLAGATDLRIFLGFATRGQFNAIVYSLAKLLTEKVLDGKATGNGKIVIFGKNSKILSNCFWFSINKCIMDLQAKGEESIIVKADKVNRQDMSFSPDVIGFVRREAIRNTTNRDTIGIVISDFISMRFYEEYSLFKTAKTNPRFHIVLATMLNWFGVDANLVNKYYGSVMSPQDIYMMNDITRITGLAEFIAKPVVSTPTTTISPVTPPIPTPNRNFTIQGTDVVIALAMATWTTESELAKLRNFFRNTAGQCVNDDSQYTIMKQANEREDFFCNDFPCLNEIINTIDVESSVPIWPSAVEMIKAGLDLLELPEHDSTVMPTLVLVIPYVDEYFILDYDDASSEFRRNLSFVDFKIILINTTDRYHKQTSISNKIINRINSFDDLEKATNPFCSEGPTIVLGNRLMWQIPVALGALFFLAVTLAFIFFLHKWRHPLQKAEEIRPIASQRSTVNPRTRVVAYGFDQLGQGEFGVTFRGQILGPSEVPPDNTRLVEFPDYGRITDSTTYVVVKVPRVNHRHYTAEILKHEIEIMKRISPQPHLPIAYMLGCSEIRPLLITVYGERGDLLQYVRGRTIHDASDEECLDHPTDKMCLRDVYSFLHQLSKALIYLHSPERQIIHRDVNLRNIFVTAQLNILLGDFGMAFSQIGNNEGEEWYRYLQNQRPPRRSLPPEGFANLHNTYWDKYDIWSFGLCAWQILESGKEPFEEIAPEAVRTHITNGNQPPRPAKTDDRLWDIMTNCWKLDPVDRLKDGGLEKLERSLDTLRAKVSGYTTLAVIDEVDETRIHPLCF